MSMPDTEEPCGFYSDPVDADGNVIAHVEFFNARGPNGPIPMVKVPHGEIVLPGEDREDEGERGA